MWDSLKANAHAIVFTDDLKNVIYLAKENPDDLELVVQMLKKFNAQNKELRFSNFIFGPITMRLLYYLDKSDLSVQLIKDPDMEGFFDQVESFTIAMDLLFERQKYEDVIDIFHLVHKRQMNSSRFPQEAVILTLGFCYKLNTKESMNMSLDILRNAKEAGASLLRKGVTFASALALKQALALADMDRIEEILVEMKFALERDNPQSMEKREFYCKETLDAIKAAIERQGNKEHSITFQRLEQSLQEQKFICWNDLDSALCSLITRKPEYRPHKQIIGFESNFYAQLGYNNRKTEHYSNHQESFWQPKGLHDLDE